MENKIDGSITICFTIRLDSNSVDFGLDAEGEFFDLIGDLVKKDDFDGIIHDLLGKIQMWMSDAVKAKSMAH